MNEFNVRQHDNGYTEAELLVQVAEDGGWKYNSVNDVTGAFPHIHGVHNMPDTSCQ